MLYERLAPEDSADVLRFLADGLEVFALARASNLPESLLDITTILDTPDHLDTRNLVDDPSVIRLVSIVFERLTDRSFLYRWFVRMYDSEDIEYYFRRLMFIELKRLLELGMIVSQNGLSGYDNWLLAPTWPRHASWREVTKLCRDKSLTSTIAKLLPEPLRICFSRIDMGEDEEHGILYRVFSSVRHIGGAWLWTLRRLRLRGLRDIRAEYLFRTYATDMGVEAPGEVRLRTVDFIVDGQVIPKEHCLFWAEPKTPPERASLLRQSGYRMLDESSVFFSLPSFLVHAMPLLVTHSLRLLLSVHQLDNFRSFARVLFANRIMWEEIVRNVRPSVWVSYNDIYPLAVLRNLVLRHFGCTTVFYQHSANTILGSDGDWAVNSAYPYLVFDVFASWGEAHTKLVRRHPSAIKKYWEVGCLWSGLVTRIGTDQSLKAHFQEQLNSHIDNVTARSFPKVAVFDTSQSAMLSRDDLGAFYLGIARLANRLPEALFLLKPKKPLDELFKADRELMKRVSRALADMPNMVLLPERFETAAAIALTDLTVNACFTSTALEAMGAGKRSTFYDPTDSMPRAFWRQVPGMVCVSDDELLERVKHLLWQCDEATYTKFLHQECTRFEGYFDGQAIARLREKLAMKR